MTILRDGNAQHALSATHSTRSVQRTARAQRIAVQGEGGELGGVHPPHRRAECARGLPRDARALARAPATIPAVAAAEGAAYPADTLGAIADSLFSQAPHFFCLGVGKKKKSGQKPDAIFLT